MLQLFKKIFTYGLVSALIISTTNSQCFLDKLLISHKMSYISLTGQKDGFLLNDLLFNAQQATAAVTNRDQASFNKLIAHNSHFELVYPIHHCLDLTLYHEENKDVLVKELAVLVQSFNDAIDPVNKQNIAIINQAQQQAIQRAFDNLSVFINNNGISSAHKREIIKELQKEATDTNEPAQSIVRTEYVLPALTATVIIGSIFVWKKWFSSQFWDWWNSTPPLAENNVTLGNVMVKGQELALANNARVIQSHVARQSGLTCGQHALHNATTILNSINNTNLYTQLNDATTATTKITAMKDFLTARADAQQAATRTTIMNKLNNPATLQQGDLLPLAHFLASDDVNKFARLEEFNTANTRLTELNRIDPLSKFAYIRNNITNIDTTRQQLVAELQPLATLNREVFGNLITEAQKTAITADNLTSEVEGSFYEIVNHAQQQYRNTLQNRLRTIVTDAIAHMTNEEKEGYATAQALQARNNNLNGNAEFIGSGPIEALLQNQYPQFRAANANAAENRKITVIESPDQYVPTPTQLQEGSIAHPQILGIDLFENIRNALTQPGEYIHAFVLGNMRQASDAVGSQGGGHWITLVVYKHANGQRNYIVADSMNYNELQSIEIKKVITALEGDNAYTVTPA